MLWHTPLERELRGYGGWGYMDIYLPRDARRCGGTLALWLALGGDAEQMGWVFDNGGVIVRRREFFGAYDWLYNDMPV